MELQADIIAKTSHKRQLYKPQSSTCTQQKPLDITTWLQTKQKGAQQANLMELHWEYKHPLAK